MYSKLIFTKSIDQIFYNLENLANEIGIGIKKFQNLDIDIILKSFNNLEQERLRKIISRNGNTPLSKYDYEILYFLFFVVFLYSTIYFNIKLFRRL